MVFVKWLRSQRILKLVDDANEGPKTHYLVLKYHISGDHGLKCDILVTTLICDGQAWEFEV